LFIVAGSAAMMFAARAVAGETLLDPLIIRDALVLGAAGSIAADTETLRYGARRASPEARRSLVQLATLDELAALVGLAFLNAYFRPSGGDVTWHLPSTAWLFVTFGLALVVGIVVYAIVRLPATRTESIALLLGSVAFVSGIASALHLSPLVVCFVVGMLLANFPGEYKQRLVENLARLEMPIYLVFLIVAGAMWSPNLLGWAAMLVLLVARFVGRWAGGRIVWRNIDAHLPSDARRSLVFAPMGTLPIAVAVNAALLYPDGELPTILTATIGGAIICEVALALLWRREEPGGHTGPSEAVQ
jgi:Kef-type K+ transport system membrane component KefB